MNDVSNNLSSILFELKLSHSDFAKASGISFNTISNILNGKVSPSDETIEKIINYIQKKGFSKNDLFKESISIYNVRITASTHLSGNEKAAFCKFSTFWEEKISVSYDLEYNNPLSKIKSIPTYIFFDLYTEPYDGYDEFTPDLRLDEFLKCRTYIKNLNDWLKYFLKPTKKTKELFGRPYYSINLSNPVKPDIIEIVFSLGIKIGFESFGTKKIKSFSTSLDFVRGNLIESRMNYTPCIIINKDVCKTFEQFKYLIAKEFYFMINTKYSSEYTKFDVRNIMLENEKTEADFFAEEILLPNNLFLKVWEENKRYSSYVFDNVTRIKGYFNISYELIINKIRQNNLMEYSKEQYVDETKRYYTENELNYKIVQDEPLPSNLNYLENDFFSTIFIAAYKLNRLSETEICKFLFCTKDELNNKGVGYLVNEIISEEN